MEWIVNKQSKMPLYLQLKDLVKYSISTGAIQHGQRLPTVHGLAKQLAVNFETVRKAYKDLEREGLVSTQRGRGTFVKDHVAPQLPLESRTDSVSDPAQVLQQIVRQLLRTGKSVEEVKEMVASILKRLAEERKRKIVFFVECNPLQAREITAVLKEFLKLNIQPVLLDKLREEIDRTRNEDLALVITTGFHMSEVLHIIGDRQIPVDFVTTNMSPETRRKIDAFPKDARFGFICRDQQTRELYPSSLKAELGIRSEVSSCLLGETDKVAALLRSVDVLLLPPSVYNTIRKKAPKQLPIFNIQDRVDPLSLGMLKNRLAAGAASPLT